MMPDKYIVFDLDETLGYFTEIGIIWNCLKTSYNISGQRYFDKLCETFEKEYFRPGIFKALNYIIFTHKKFQGCFIYEQYRRIILVKNDYILSGEAFKSAGIIYRNCTWL